MSRTLKDKWKKKYQESLKLTDYTVDVLTGFNVNLDIIHTEYKVKDVEKPELLEKVENLNDLYSCLTYSIQNQENHEVDYTGFPINIPGEERIGGQAGIISEYLAGNGNGVIFYTPYLSEEITDKLDEKILYPVFDKEFYLKNVKDAVNSKKTKKNHIFEFKNKRSGRLILSDSLKGFGPYFNSKVEENLPLIESNIDCCILSGFQNADGNIEAKMRKSSTQLAKIDKPIHIEYVHNPKTAELILDQIIPEADSIGLDETELEEILSLLNIDGEKPFNFGQAFEKLSQLLERLDLSRIHMHTYRYHILVTKEDYRTNPKKIRDSMLFGEASAIQAADKGQIPGINDIKDFELGKKEIRGLETMKNFGEFNDLDNFEENGIANIQGFNVLGIPTIIHNDPERTVGMGDIISAGAFSSEFKNFD